MMLIKHGQQTARVDDLKYTKFNPSTRTDQRRLNSILKSAEKFGIFQPVLVNAETNEVLDGNRRLTVAKQLGLTTVPVVLVYDVSRNQAKDIYVEVNTTTRRFSESEKLSTIHHGGPKTWGRANNDYDVLEAVLSKDELNEVIDSGKGGRLVYMSRAYCRRIGWPAEVPGTLRKVIWWMYKTGSQRDAGIVIRRDDKTDVRKLRAAVEQMHPIWPRRQRKKKEAA